MARQAMTSPLEKLQADAAHIVMRGAHPDASTSLDTEIRAVLAQAHALGKTEGLEEAAMVCEKILAHSPRHNWRYRKCAEAIKSALKPKREGS